jgi:hypothetical protein
LPSWGRERYDALLPVRVRTAPNRIPNRPDPPAAVRRPGSLAGTSTCRTPLRPGSPEHWRRKRDASRCSAHHDLFIDAGDDVGEFDIPGVDLAGRALSPADHVTAEAWLQIARALRNVTGYLNDFRGWTSTVVRNRALDFLRVPFHGNPRP